MNGTGSILKSCILYNGLQAAKKLFLKGQCSAKFVWWDKKKNVSLTTISVSRDPYTLFFNF